MIFKPSVIFKSVTESRLRNASAKYIQPITIMLAMILVACPATAMPGHDVGASFRSVAAFSRNFNFPPFFGAGNTIDFYSQSRLRVTAEGPACGNAEYHAHIVQAGDFSTSGAGSGLSGLGATELLGDYRVADATINWLDTGRFTGSLYLDRLNVSFRFENSDLRIGRQAISFGKAYFWNPLDVFMPFDPNQFDRDYKPGVDAIRYDIQLGYFSGITLVAAAGSKKDPPGVTLTSTPQSFEADWFGSSILARYYGHSNGWDYSLQAGRIYGGYQAGAGLVGEVNDWQLRAEGAYFFADSTGPPLPLTGVGLLTDNFTLVVGAGRYYPIGLDFQAEYFYNGAGDDDTPDAGFARMQYGGSLHSCRHILGVTAGYEYTPLIYTRLSLIHSISDQSTQVQPTVTYSLTGNSDLIAGAVLNFGARPTGFSPLSPGVRSEFGSFPDFIYTEYKIYF